MVAHGRTERTSEVASLVVAVQDAMIRLGETDQ
jgi:hypothetical protein